MEWGNEDTGQEEDNRVEGWKGHDRNKNAKDNETEKWRHSLNYARGVMPRRQQSGKMERPRQEEERQEQWYGEMNTQPKRWEGRTVK